MLTPQYRARPPRQTDPAAEENQPPALLDELSSQQFAEWRRHPVSKLLLERYLPDYRQALEQELLRNFVGGGLSLPDEQLTRGRLMAAHILENLTLDQIRGFYDLQPLTRRDVTAPKPNEPRGPL